MGSVCNNHQPISPQIESASLSPSSAQFELRSPLSCVPKSSDRAKLRASRAMGLNGRSPSSPKITSGDAGYVLEDVPHLTDFMPDLPVLRLWLFSQNLSFMVAGCTVTALLVYYGLMSTAFVPFVLLVVATNVSGAVGVLSTLAGTILIERE